MVAAGERCDLRVLIGHTSRGRFVLYRLHLRRYCDPMATETALIDADAYLARGETERREELIGGRIFVSTPTGLHQVVALRIGAALEAWTSSAAGRGRASLPVDLRLTDLDVLAPDLLWWADPKRFDLHAPANTELPDLVVEIRSPSTWVRDIGVKRRLYEDHGVGELWLVDPLAPAVLAYRRSRRDAPVFDVEIELGMQDSLTSPAMPGLDIAVGALLHTD